MNPHDPRTWAQHQQHPGHRQQPGQQGPLAPPPNPSPLKPKVVVALVGGGLLVLVAFGAFIRHMAHKQEAECTALAQQAATQVAAGASSARDTIAAARGVCHSMREDELAALEATLTQLEARPALLAAGFKSEQFSRAAMLPLCKAKDRMPVEMIAHQVQGQPRYWDCDDHIVYQDVPQTSAACKARGLDYTTMRDEHGQDVGACKIEELLAATQLRQACKVGPNAKIQPADEAEVKAMCRMAVERGLKAPKSAEHPGAFDQDGAPTKAKDGCVTVYASYVDALNPMGVKLRTRYRCVYDPRTGVASIETQ